MVAAAKKPKTQPAEKPAAKKQRKPKGELQSHGFSPKFTQPAEKKKLKKVTGPLAVIDKPVSFGGVSIGKNTGRIGVTLDREWLELEQASDLFCNRRLNGKVVLGRAGDAANQTTLVDDLDHEVVGAFDVKGFRVTTDVLAAGLTFSLADVDIAELAKFSKGVGRLVVYEIGEIPADAVDEGLDDDEAPMLKADGPWAKVLLSTLFDPKKAIHKALKKAGLDTVGDFAEYQAKKGDFWAKDLAGIGPKARQDMEDTFEKFWLANPQT